MLNNYDKFKIKILDAYGRKPFMLWNLGLNTLAYFLFVLYHYLDTRKILEFQGAKGIRQ